MPVMRDKHSKVVRDVPQVTLDRWPEDYEPVPAKRPAPRPRERKTKPKRTPAQRSTEAPAEAHTDVPTVGTETKG